MARRNYLAACLISTAIVPGMLHADGPLPTDPTVVVGDVTITSPSDVQLLLQQASQGAIIDWGSFSIGAGYGVDFQNGNGATLNRVTGGNLSSIMGSLTATGSVFLVNENGVYFGRDGVVETGGRFVASTLDIANQDFLNGGDNVFAGESPAYVINLGRISSLGGDVALLARNVVNDGTVTAPNGTVGLVAGREILMRDASVADGMFSVRIGGSDTSVSESGAIAAAAAELRANGGNVYALAGNTQGTITATGVAKVKGRVFLTAGDTGKVEVDKKVKATDADGTGGQIAVNGGTVDMAGTLDASGIEGGVVVIDSAISTVFSGTVLAFGDDVDHGGFVEVSGRHLSFGGSVQTDGGTLLIDPENIEIAGDNATLLLGGASQITTQDLETLLGTQDVIIQTSADDGEAGTIAVSDQVFYNSAFSLTLLAHGDILAIESIQNSGRGDINLVAGWDGSTSTIAFDPSVFDGADLATQTIFGNSSGVGYIFDGGAFETAGTVLIGSLNGFNGAAVGSRQGATRVYAGNLSLVGNSGGEVNSSFAELGFNVPNDTGAATGDIVVRATGDITLTAGSGTNASVQIGHGGMNSFDGALTVDMSGAISIEALGNLSLTANVNASNAYAMVGHGSLDSFGFQAGGTRQGDITITTAGEIDLDEGVFNGQEAWIGHASSDFRAVSNADILLTALAFDYRQQSGGGFDLKGPPLALVGAGGIGRLNMAMVSEDLFGGNFTAIATDSSLRLINSTGGSSCECDFIDTATDFVAQASDDIILGPTFFFSNTGGGNAVLAAGENFQNNTSGAGFGTMKGVWLVYSTRPDQNTNDIGVMDADFILYSTGFDPENPVPSSFPSGSGLVYSVFPQFTVNPVTMTFGDAFVPPSFILTVDGDEVDPLDFGFASETPFVDPDLVTVNGDGFFNAGSYTGAISLDVEGVGGAEVSFFGIAPGDLTVNQRVVTVTLGNDSRTYDGTTGFNGAVGYANFAGTDDETILTGGPDFGFTGGDGSGRNAGVYTVSASGITEASGNYAFDVTDTGTLTIGQAVLTAFITGNPTKTYDGTTLAELVSGNFVINGFVTGEGATVTQTEGAYNTPNAADEVQITAILGAGDFTADGGTLLANYVLPTEALGLGGIDQAVLTAAIIGDPSKVYDGSDFATLTSGNFQLNGFATGEGATVTQTTGTYASANASTTNQVTSNLSVDFIQADSSTNLNNYVLPTSATGNGIITQAVLTAAIIGDPSKVYDGTTLASLNAENFTLSGFIEGEGATVTATDGTYASPNASLTNAVTAALGGGDFTADGGTLLANYVLPTSATGNGIITQAVLTAAIIGDPTKTYDGNTIATLTSGNFQLTGFVTGEGAAVTETAGTYASPDASDTNPVTASLGAGDFTADGGTLLANYVLPTTATGNGIITRAALTISAAIIGDPSKVYDGTTLATLTSANFVLDGFVDGEGATVTETTGTYASANASLTNLITAILTAGDFDADEGTNLGNYTLPTEATGNGIITQAVLTAAIIGDPSKVYDGTNIATLTAGNFVLTGFVTGEGADVTETTGTYASPNASTTNAVTATLGGGDFAANGDTLLANYVLPTSATGNGVITQAVLTAAIIGDPSKVYDGTTLASLNAENFTLSGFIEGEGATVTATDGTYASPNASLTNAVTAALGGGDFTADGGTLLANYVLPTTATGNGIITQAVLTAAIIGDPTKTYDGNTIATLTSGNFQLTGFVTGEGATVTETAGTYASPDASDTNPVTASLGAGDFTADGGTLLANYILPTTATGNGIITRAALTISAAIIGDPSKVYDGTTLATLTSANFVLDGFVDGEGATVTETQGTYASANASLTNLITAILTAGDFDADEGTNLGNYTLPTEATGNGIITQAVLTAAIIGDPSKVYDGTNIATLTAGNFVLTGFVTGEGADVTETTGTYASPNASTTNAVTATLGGGDFAANGDTLLANYVLPTSATGNGVITQAVLTAAIIGDPSKVYDGTNLATLTSGNFQLTGFVTGEGATVTATDGTYASPNASLTNAVTAALGGGDFTADGGTLLANYILPTTATGNGIITQAVLTAAIIGDPTKVYDGTNLATLTAGNFVLTGFIAGEGADVTETAGTYATPNAGSGIGVTAALGAGDFAANGGTLLANYVLPTSAAGTGTITQATLTAAITGNPTKTYDGTTVATLTAGDFTLTGFVAGEGATVTETTGTYASQNASTANAVTATLGAGDFAATGGTLLSNYILPVVAAGNGIINQAVLTAAIIGNPTKPYDGTTTAFLSAANFQLIGFVAGEGATVTQTTGTYASPDIGEGNTVTADLAPGDFTANGGTLLSNYVLPTSASGPGTIDSAPPPVPPVLEVRGIDAFDTTPLGEPAGPADGLEVISTETTKQIIDEINAGVAFCKQLVRQEYMVDCLSDRLQSVADGLSAVGEYSEVRRALEDAAAQLHSLALSNSGGLAQAVHRAGGRTSSRPLTAVNSAVLASVNAQAAAIVENTELVLLRSSSSDRQRVAFEQISQVVDSTKVLLRSS